MRKKGSKINRAGSWIPQDLKQWSKENANEEPAPRKSEEKDSWLSGGNQVLEEVFQVLQGIQPVPHQKSMFVL